MKILEINAVSGHGSTGVIVQDIKHLCEKNGIDCDVVFSLSQKGIDSGNELHIGFWLTNKLHALLSRIGGKQGYFSFLSTWKLKRHIVRTHPDLVHLHNLHGNYVNVPVLLKFIAEKDIPTIITMHDCWWFTGGCYHYVETGCKRWMNHCNHCPQRYLGTPAYLYDASSKIFNDKRSLLLAIPRLVMVGVSEWMSDQARKSFLKNRPIYTIHNGVNLDIFTPTSSDFRDKLGLRNKFVVLGPYSKWMQEENTDTLNYFLNNMPKNSILVLFGCRKTMRLSVSDKLKIVPFIKDRKELARLYSMADVFVNCTRVDSFSTINLEAQACGVRVVTYDSTGCSETVDGSYSTAVPTGDYRRLFIDTFSRSNSNIDTPRSFAMKNFNSNANYIQYLILFNSTLRQSID